MMKKLVALMLCMAMLCVAVSALALEAADVTGVWYLQDMSQEGISINPAALGMEMTMTVNEDGTGALATTGEDETAMTWVIEGETLNVIDETSTTSMTMVDGLLVMSTDDMTMTFGREPAAVEYVRPVPTTAAAEADFYGNWTVAYMFDDDMILPAAMFGMEMTMTISENGVQLDGAEEAAAVTFADGQLSMTDGETTVALVMNEDGSITMASDSVSISFVKAE